LLLLHEAGADPEARANRNRTPAHLCAEGGHAEALRLLHSFGADMTAW
jgi:ankyrin repeat protein